MLLGVLANWHRAMFFEGRGAAGFLDTGRHNGTNLAVGLLTTNQDFGVNSPLGLGLILLHPNQVLHSLQGRNLLV